MTDQPPFTIAELGAKFGSQLAQAYAEIITLEKRIEAMAKNEVRLLEYIEDMKEEIADLKAGIFPRE